MLAKKINNMYNTYKMRKVDGSNKVKVYQLGAKVKGTKFKFKKEQVNSRWLHNNALGFLVSHLYYYPVPANLNYFWGFGSILGALLVIQIVTGLFLAIHYTPDVDHAFYSVEFIMRNVKNGWLIRYMHSSGASLLFIALYCHMLRALYYRAFRNTAVWVTGLFLLLLMMATAFLGYILVWGQMSLWGATVITNLFGTLPFVGQDLVILLWGGFSVENPTLKRFYILHFLLPFLMVGLTVLHILYLHQSGSSNPLGVDSVDFVCFYPKYFIKDLFGFICFYGVGLLILVFFYPNLLGHVENYTEANSLITPKHITPEWYFEPFYAILRSIPSKTGGVFVMFLAIVILFFLPLFEFTLTTKFSSVAQFCFWFFVGNFICLGWLGMCPIEEPYITLSRFATIFYFIYFLFILPILAEIERVL